MVETGVSEFGNRSYGVVTKDDMAKLVMWAIGFAKANSNEGYAVRKLVRRLMPMFSPVDLIALADLADTPPGKVGNIWHDFAEELRAHANKPPFKQE